MACPLTLGTASAAQRRTTVSAVHGIRDDPRQLKLHREVVPILLDVGVHPVGVGREQTLRVRVIARPFFSVERTPEHHQPGAAVVVERVRSENLGEASLVPPTPHLHLPEPVLRHDVALGKEEIVIVLGIDVRYPPLVPDDLHHLSQTWELQFPVDLRKRPARQLCERLWRGSRYGAAREARGQRNHGDPDEASSKDEHETS